MHYSGMQLANLDQTAVERLQQLEQELGVELIALEPGPDFARLDRDQIARLRAAEDEFGTVLIAFRRDAADAA